jgi:two-component system NtrC family sensor kinase
MSKSPEHERGKSDKSVSRRDEQGANAHLTRGLPVDRLLQSLPVAIVAFDRDLKIIGANSQAAKLIHLCGYVDESLAKGTDHHIWLGWTEHLRSALSTGKPCTFDEVGYTLEGGTRLLRIICTPLKVGEEEAAGGTVVIEDVTEKVHTQRQLADTERLAAVGRLASKVAHELNNPMDGILRYINLAMRVVEQEKLEKPKEYLSQCRRGLMRMVQIISELLEFSRSTRASFAYAKVEQLIEEAVRTLEPTAENLNVRILRNYARDIPEIRSGNLFQVFCNLAKNALDAMPDGGELTISTRLKGGSTAVVEFRDTGSGFAPENAEAIFEPFFTTKEKGKGTGLGLAICRDILEIYHGRITAENAPGGGSVFTVYLPVTGKSAKSSSS